MHGQTIESVDVFDNDWQKRVRDIQHDDLLQMNTFGRMLVALSLARTDYFAKVSEKTTSSTVLVMFDTRKEQVQVLDHLRQMMLRGEAPNDRDLQRIPIRAVPPEMRCTLLAHTRGITELQRRLEDVQKQYEIGYIIFVMLSAEDSGDPSTYFIGSLLTRAALTLEVQRKLVCLSCGAQGTEKSPLKRCGRCGTALYCSRECQSRDWAQHKARCPTTPAKDRNVGGSA